MFFALLAAPQRAVQCHGSAQARGVSQQWGCFPKSCSLAGTEAAHTEQQLIILHVTARDA